MELSYKGHSARVYRSVSVRHRSLPVALASQILNSGLAPMPTNAYIIIIINSSLLTDAENR